MKFVLLYYLLLEPMLHNLYYIFCHVGTTQSPIKMSVSWEVTSLWLSPLQCHYYIILQIITKKLYHLRFFFFSNRKLCTPSTPCILTAFLNVFLQQTHQSYLNSHASLPQKFVVLLKIHLNFAQHPHFALGSACTRLYAHPLIPLTDTLCMMVQNISILHHH